jgi:uncharacterized RDD family membrane protein YckC
MNLESASSKKEKKSSTEDISLDDFDFKAITSGLGFHHSSAQDVKPLLGDRPAMAPVKAPPIHKEMSVYQNDLSLFYGKAETIEPSAIPAIHPKTRNKVEKTYLLATKKQRFFAYAMDLFSIAAVLGIVLTVMARTIKMDLVQVWTAFPHEITPLVLILFAGFYVIYFSIFEKAPGSTIGKNIFGLRVVNLNNENQNLSALLIRSVITLVNFISLGLFAWFDLQNKITQSKVVKVK